MSDVGQELSDKFVAFALKYYKRKPTKMFSKRFVKAFWDDRNSAGDDLMKRIFQEFAKHWKGPVSGIEICQVMVAALSNLWSKPRGGPV